MASQVVINLIDDLNGRKADETVTFGIDGVVYEIDLSETNAQKLRECLEPYVTKSRRVAGRTKRTQLGPDPKAVRAWAKSERIPIPAKGRIPTDVLVKFAEATNPSEGLRLKD